jgi:DNA uptake protein ComE-like DNA-binding protein
MIAAFQGADNRWPTTSAPLNLESTLALGGKVRLSACELPDLELIPTIGPQTARKIYDNREALLQRAPQMSHRSFALITIKGIGPVTAEKIAPWLELR